MKTILPFELSPTVKTYLNQAYPLGIIEGYYGKSITEDLVCDNYINCLFNREDKNLFCQHPEDGWFEKCRLIRKETLMCRERSKDCLSEALREVRKRLLEGQYVFAMPNERYLSKVSYGRSYDFDHECLLYGLDDDEGVYMSAGYIRGHYTAYKISYEEYEQAMLHTQSGVVEFLFYTLSKTYIIQEPNVANITSKLSDYLNSDIPELSAKTELSLYISSGILKFGIDVWEELPLYISKTGSLHMPIDMRYPRSFAEHKLCMKLRTDRLFEKGYLSDRYLLRAAEVNYIKAQTAMSLAMKYNLTGDRYDLLRAVQNITEINKTERTFVKKLINELNGTVRASTNSEDMF